MANKPPLHVAVGVVRDCSGKILIAKRPEHLHQGGLWEFPGGKVESGETVLQALRRELREEVGIEILTAKPLIKIDYRYPDRHVVLDVWHSREFDGEASSCEGQALQWVAPRRLWDFQFPAANRPIICAALLPDRYAILEGRNVDEVMDNLERILSNGVELLQIRLKSLPSAELETVYRAAVTRCRQSRVEILLNSDLDLPVTEADGVHLSSRALLACQSRPQARRWVGASCHNLDELQHAERIGADFAVLAPVLPTATHPEAVQLGWDGMAVLVEQVNLPVYGLGGLGLRDLPQAIAVGAQGIAGISAFL